jgi:hypothetical protein
MGKKSLRLALRVVNAPESNAAERRIIGSSTLPPGLVNAPGSNRQGAFRSL